MSGVALWDSGGSINRGSDLQVTQAASDTKETIEDGIRRLSVDVYVLATSTACRDLDL